MSDNEGRALTGRVIVVTGGGRGMGRSTVLAAARAGADVAFSYHESEPAARALVQEVQALGTRVQAYPCDLRDTGQVRRFIAAVESDFGRIDGLVNNAGIMPESAFLEITQTEWDEVIATDLTGAFVATQAALPGMLANGGGNIVFVSSRLALVGLPGVAHYTAAKAGLIALAKSISREFGQQGIRANTVAPGVTNTDMGRTVMEGEVGRKRMAELPLGRFGEPEEVAQTILFLLSDASSLLIGQTLHPNAGGLMP
ncbi:MAG: SDR family NAD(P)-dependent oxidoreductase [Beutenbergiaceae bacterium]